MSGFRVVVVDDEPLAREAMIGLLRQDDEVTRIESCASGEAARVAIAQTAPHIVFLDIEMPGTDGLELARGLSAPAPAFVLVTAFSEYAADAFDVQALDYVLKPFTDGRFHEALSRAKQRVREAALGRAAPPPDGLGPEPDSQPQAGGYLQRLSIPAGDRAIVLKPDEIRWIKAEDYYVLVHSTRGRHLLRASLSTLETRLDPARFLRIHRAALVNLDAVTAVEQGPRGVLRLALVDGARLPVSRARKATVARRLAPRLRST